MELLEDALKSHFGFTTFRPGQRELMEAVLADRDALGVLPTGGGKSLVYQLLATVRPGLTIVVSPLIALMKDQVDAFNRRGRGLAVALHSNLSRGQAAKALAQVQSGQAVLFYIAPERLELAGYRDQILALKPKLLVIDEAHCVSQWGHDFRPSYMALQGIIAKLRPCPVLALTATATPGTRKEIVAGLGLKDPLGFVAPLDRPNLRFEVYPCSRDEKPRHLLSLSKGMAGEGSHIVYVGTRKDADQITMDLRSAGLRAVAYHAGMDSHARQAAQEAWLSGERPIAVATVAFGMGIDKPDVRAVLHYQHPASLEAYYQEAGRAGRDGALARCITLFSSKDVSLAHYFILNRYPSRPQVGTLLAAISPGGTASGQLRLSFGDLTEEQVNVALLTLLEQRLIWQDGKGNYRRKDGDGASLRFSLDSVVARKNADYRRLEAVVAYCKDQACHRACLLRYFGEILPSSYRCGNCSACLAGSSRVGRARPQEDAARILKAHRAVFESDRPLTPRMLARFLGASRSRRVPPAWRELSGYGALAHIPIKELHGLCARLLDVESGTACSERESRKAVAEARASILQPVLQHKENTAPDPPSPDAKVFWQSKNRAFALEELQRRKVSRKVGLSVLGLVAEAEGKLAPSGVANVLRGSRTCDAVRVYPGLVRLNHFGAEGGRKYEQLLPDVLAMYAKGYLYTSRENSKKLELTATGRAVLAGKRQAGRIIGGLQRC